MARDIWLSNDGVGVTIVESKDDYRIWENASSILGSLSTTKITLWVEAKVESKPERKQVVTRSSLSFLCLAPMLGTESRRSSLWGGDHLVALWRVCHWGCKDGILLVREVFLHCFSYRFCCRVEHEATCNVELHVVPKPCLNKSTALLLRSTWLVYLC